MFEARKCSAEMALLLSWLFFFVNREINYLLFPVKYPKLEWNVG